VTVTVTVTVLDATAATNVVALGLETWQRLLLALCQAAPDGGPADAALAPLCAQLATIDVDVAGGSGEAPASTWRAVVARLHALFDAYVASLQRHFARLAGPAADGRSAAALVKLRGTLSMSLVQLLPLALLLDHHAQRSAPADAFTASLVRRLQLPGTVTSVEQLRRCLQAIARPKIAAYFEHCRAVRDAATLLRPLALALEATL
jgi:hypothetical protein